MVKFLSVVLKGGCDVESVVRKLNYYEHIVQKCGRNKYKVIDRKGKLAANLTVIEGDRNGKTNH